GGPRVAYKRPNCGTREQVCLSEPSSDISNVIASGSLMGKKQPPHLAATALGLVQETARRRTPAAGSRDGTASHATCARSCFHMVGWFELPNLDQLLHGLPLGELLQPAA